MSTCSRSELTTSLDFARLVGVSAFLADDVELVEEEHASPRPHLVEQTREANRRLSQVAGDDGFVAHGH